MKNLENLGVQELSNNENFNIQGGGPIANFFENLIAALKCDCVDDGPYYADFTELAHNPKM